MLQVSAQDIQEKFWEIIEEISVNAVIKWFTNNIVFTIIVFTRFESSRAGRVTVPLFQRSSLSRYDN